LFLLLKWFNLKGILDNKFLEGFILSLMVILKVFLLKWLQHISEQCRLMYDQ
jgi:hypothetical protein